MTTSNVRYVVKYPHVSSVITKEESTVFHPYNPNEIYAKTWAEAHDFLRAKAMQCVVKANEELSRAVAHLNEVMYMRDPDQE